MPTPTRDARAKIPRPSTRKRPPPNPTALLLLVRHGTTPTTGKVLPGRAAGLHLSEKGEKEAATVAERLYAWATAGSGDTPSTNGKKAKPRIAAVYASP